MTATKEISAPGMAVRTAATLFVFVIIFTGLLSAAYLWTKPAIEASATEEKMKLVNEVLPSSEYDNALLEDVITLPATKNSASMTPPRYIGRARRANHQPWFSKQSRPMVMPARSNWFWQCVTMAKLLACALHSTRKPQD